MSEVHPEKFCPKCGKDNISQDSFCRGCGTDLVRPPGIPEKFCPDCGKENISGDKFCGGCGIDLTHIKKVTPSKSTKHYRPYWPLIIAGVLLIVCVYTLPFYTLSPLGQVTLNKAFTLCNNPLFSCGNQFINGFFYSAWVIGIILILFGAFSEK